VIDIVIGAVMEMEEIDNQMKSKVLRAFNKVLWIQNDLFARHYIDDSSEKEAVVVSNGGGSSSGCPFSGK